MTNLTNSWKLAGVATLALAAVSCSESPNTQITVHDYADGQVIQLQEDHQGAFLRVKTKDTEKSYTIVFNNIEGQDSAYLSCLVATTDLKGDAEAPATGHCVETRTGREYTVTCTDQGVCEVTNIEERQPLHIEVDALDPAKT